MGRLLLAALIVLGAPALSSAQRSSAGVAPASHVAMGGAHASFNGPHPNVHLPTGTPTAPRGSVLVARSQASSHGIRRVNRHNNFAAPEIGTTDLEDAPGLGFDFPHLAAVSGNRRHHGNPFGAFPFGFSGFLLGSPSVIVEEGPSGGQTAEAGEESPENEPEISQRQPGRRSLSPRGYDPQNSGSEAAAPPVADLAEYVFVRRDGGLVFAVAYSWDNGTLRYVTREGMRRTLTRDAIDLSATQQFNEQRGLIFRSPA